MDSDSGETNTIFMDKSLFNILGYNISKFHILILLVSFFLIYGGILEYILPTKNTVSYNNLVDSNASAVAQFGHIIDAL